MKIVFTTDQIYLHGGIEKVLSIKANYFADVFGDEVYIVTYNQNNQKPRYHYSNKIKFIDLGINYKIEKSYFSFENINKLPKHISTLSKIINSINPDVLISSNYGPDFYFLPFISKKVKKLKEFHSSRYFSSKNVDGFKSSIFKKLNYFIEERYDQLVVLNKEEKEFYPGNKISVIPNPITVDDRIANLNNHQVIAAGRISPVKNFGELIEIWKEVNHCFPDWELHFYGEDYLETQSKLEMMIKSFNLQGFIKFMGTTEDIKKTMMDYSIYAMTSETECFPMVLLEALSVGLPVVSYDAPTGPKHILNHGFDSILVPIGDRKVFSQELKRLMNNEVLRHELANNALKNVKKFTPEIVMNKWIELFRSLKITHE